MVHELEDDLGKGMFHSVFRISDMFDPSFYFLVDLDYLYSHLITQAIINRGENIKNRNKRFCLIDYDILFLIKLWRRDFISL